MQEHAHHRRDRHGHEHDQGMAGSIRNLRLPPVMWRSPVSSEVVSAIGPKAGERVVDLGAGMGAATVEALLTDASVVAIDPTPLIRAILWGRRWCPGRGSLSVLAGAEECSSGTPVILEGRTLESTLRQPTTSVIGMSVPAGTTDSSGACL